MPYNLYINLTLKKKTKQQQKTEPIKKICERVSVFNTARTTTKTTATTTKTTPPKKKP
jgi:hypothetical protein